MIDREKLRKVEAILTDRAASDGEKAAAREIRNEWYRRRAEEARVKIRSGGLTYLLGRAWSRSRRSFAAAANPRDQTLMYALGRALRKTFSKR